MAITTFKLNTSTYIFQKGITLELDDQVGGGMYQDELAVGYVIPDTGQGEPGILPAEHVQIVATEAELGEEHFGKCILTRVDNYLDTANIKSINAKEISGEVIFRQVETIHYDDCQQLKFHMPEYAWDAHEICLFDKVRGLEIFREPVSNKLNGGTMILLDTLPYKPGFYSITASWPNGWTHEIHFIKLIPGFPFDEVYQHPKGNLTMVQNDNGYRLFDSNGVEIINEVQKKHDELKTILSRRMEYEQDGRGGTMTYVDGSKRIKFDWEFAAGKGIVIIFITSPTFWEAGTGTPLSERDEILEFVAKSVIRDKAPGCVYEIYDDFLNINRY